MLFHMHQKQILNIRLKIAGSNIESIENFNFLGITINTLTGLYINAVYTRIITRDIRLHGGQMPCQIAVL